MKKTLLLVVAALLLSTTPALAEKKGAKATNFTLRDIKGKYVRLSDYKDHVVLMSFWATWCKPCLIELKHLNKLYKKLKSKKFVVLAISIDGPRSRAKVKPTVRNHKFKFPVAIDKQKRVVKLYNPKNSAPYTVYIKKGRIIKTREGFQVSDLPAIEAEIKKLLK